MLTEARDQAQRSPVGKEVEPMLAAVERVARSIPPLWPLASSVAVNPFLGQSDEDLASAAARLARVAGVRLTMPRRWYHEALSEGSIDPSDLEAALAAAPTLVPALSVAELREAGQTAMPALDTIADLAARVSGIDWPALIADRVGAWAAGYFDFGQALWQAPRDYGAYRAWRAVAARDLTPEIAGLRGFARFVTLAPETADAALLQFAQRLDLPAAACESYFHRLLMTLGGWSQYARHDDWQAELGGGQGHGVVDLLGIRVVWEAALLEQYAGPIADAWRAVRAQHALPIVPTRDQIIDAVLQEACERAAQRELAARLAEPPAARVPTHTGGTPTGAPAVAPGVPAKDRPGRPRLQVAFCIDVRSEPFRRALESVHGGIQTLGFAGFFGLRTAHRRFASDVAERRLPVLLAPTIHSRSGTRGDAGLDRSTRLTARAVRAWGRFKLAAVSSFAFVEASGPLYAAKLLHDALGLPVAASRDDPPPELELALSAEARIETAASVLRAMSLTHDFAPVVILAGHAASVVNNPHASALHCGACGGYPGDANARLLAALLNQAEVRAGLAAAGIAIPADTEFVAALHDTTTDALRLFRDRALGAAHQRLLDEAEHCLSAAGQIVRTERARHLPNASSAASIARRSRDWAEQRPEWGLTGCQAFIAAPRSRSAGRSLDGRVFLHDYDWREDGDFRILELILTAPVVVASWIGLQYYGSTVAPEAFGAGNKLLHNVVGGIGVVEGSGGLLRGGLPWQSVHDGERLRHRPLRLAVCIEAPTDAITTVLQRHPSVRTLFEHRWLHLFALDAQGRMAWRYRGGLAWEDPGFGHATR